MTTRIAMDIECRYVAVGGRLVHYRICGSGPAVVLLHDSPRSSRLHIPVMKMLASRFRVFALDTPGYGNSDPLPGPDPTIPDFAQALGETLARLGLEQAPLYATHTGAKIALALAARTGKMPLLVLDGLAIPDALPPESFIQNYMRPFQPDAEGAYLASEWVHIRDMLRWFPWFSRGAETRITMDPPNAEWLEDYAIDLFCAGPHYSDAYAAAMRWNPLEDLLAVNVPTLVAAKSDDVLYPFLDKVPAAQNPMLSVEHLSGDRHAWQGWLADTLQKAASIEVGEGIPRESAFSRGYANLPHGQLHWRRSGRESGRPLLVLSAPSTLEAMEWARALAADRPTLVPDLPGFGDSDPLPRPCANGLADGLAALIEGLDMDAVDVLAIDIAAPIGARLATRHPQCVNTLAIHGAPPLEPDTALPGTICPDIAFDPQAGTHLYRIWHMLRDSQVHWPWFDMAPASTRQNGLLADPAAMQAALVGMLKHRRHYGDSAAAALGAATPADWRAVRVPTLICLGDDPAQAQAHRIAGLVAQGRTLALPACRSEAAPLLAAALGDMDGVVP